MADKVKKLVQDVGKGDVSPVYLLHSDQEFLVTQAEKALVGALVPEADRSMCLVELEWALTDWQEIITHLRTIPMFGNRKVVALRDAPVSSKEKSSSIFDKAKKGFREGTEGKRRSAVARLMTLLGGIDWPLEALASSGPDSRGADDWDGELKIKLGPDDGAWLEEALAFAKARGMTPRQAGGDEYALEFMASIDPSRTVLVMTALNADKRLKLYKAIGKIGNVVDLSVGKGEKAQRSAARFQIDHMLKAAGKKLTPDALALLEHKTGFNLRGITRELEKIISYIGERDKITVDDVEAVVPKTREESIFELTDAIGNRNTPQALRLLTGLLDQNHHPLEILGAIHREVVNLYLARDYAGSVLRGSYKPGMYYGSFQKNIVPKIKEENGRFGKLHPFVMFKALDHQKNYERKELEGAFGLMGDVDRRLKSTRTDPRFALEEMVFKLCGMSRKRR